MIAILSKYIKFKLSGPRAHWRKFYTTSSPLTYKFPPPTAVMGIIGAIMGYDRSVFVGKLLSVGFEVVAVSTLSKHVVERFASNGREIRDLFKKPLLTKSGDEVKPNRIIYEYLINPEWELYVTAKDEAFIEELTRRLKEKDFHYPVYLGVAHCFGKLDYMGIVDELDKDAFKYIDDGTDDRIRNDKMPYLMDKNRKCVKFIDV
jgi:CRISPR-associated protein Cas5h